MGVKMSKTCFLGPLRGESGFDGLALITKGFLGKLVIGRVLSNTDRLNGCNILISLAPTGPRISLRSCFILIALTLSTWALLADTTTRWLLIMNLGFFGCSEFLGGVNWSSRVSVMMFSEWLAAVASLTSSWPEARISWLSKMPTLFYVKILCSLSCFWRAWIP